MQNRIFFPQAALDQWLMDGKVDLAGAELTILAEARKYRLAEALRITREVTGEGDSNDLVGRVKSRLFLEQLGAEVFETSMILGDRAYDVLPGWIGRPETNFREHVVSDERKKAAEQLADFDDEPKTDEDMLVRALLENAPPSTTKDQKS